MFQYYILARMLNHAIFEPLSPDFYGSTEPYKVIIRQEGQNRMVVLFLETGEAFETTKVNENFLWYFNPKTTLYLYEPWLDTVNSPFLRNGMPTVATVSPNINRYKEFRKSPGFKFLYFPLWKEVELQTVANYLCQSNMSTEFILEFFNHEKVKERFYEFGGINLNLHLIF